MSMLTMILIGLVALAAIAGAGHLLGGYFARRWINISEREIAKRIAAAKDAT